MLPVNDSNNDSTTPTGTTNDPTPQISSCWGYTTGDQRIFDETGTATVDLGSLGTITTQTSDIYTETVKSATAGQQAVVTTIFNSRPNVPLDNTFSLSSGSISLSSGTEFQQDGTLYVSTWTPALPVCPPPAVGDTFTISHVNNGTEVWRSAITVTAVGQENVTVPAGTFDTYTYSFDQVLTDLQTGNVVFNDSVQHWHNTAIGPVKMTSHAVEPLTGTTTDSLHQLTSYTIN